MTFWSFASCREEAPALAFGTGSSSAGIISYGDLARRIGRFISQLGPSAEKRLGIILCQNASEAVIAYLAALRSNDAVMLLGEQTAPASLKTIINLYQPEWIFQPQSHPIPDSYRSDHEENGWHLLKQAGSPQSLSIHPDLAVLLSTSGTTGSPKLVRLSQANIASNAKAIVEYLSIHGGVRAITTLPLNYSFGMSVINSHLEAGATIVLTESSLLTREFWDTFAYHGVTSLSGVPYTYQMLHRLNPGKLPLGTLGTLTQAGGRLPAHLIDYFQDLAYRRAWRFFVMYGQTEAAPRISYVPTNMLTAKAGSIGIAIPGGRLSLSIAGELIYEGPNVMMGYAESRADLASGDELSGRLATGDLARVDEDGYFYLRGRITRFVKIHGARINLDDIEQRMESELQTPVAAVGEDDRLTLYLPAGGDSHAAKILLTTSYRLHPTAFTIRSIESLPVTPSGKKDYSFLQP